MSEETIHIKVYLEQIKLSYEILAEIALEEKDTKTHLSFCESVKSVSSILEKFQKV